MPFLFSHAQTAAGLDVRFLWFQSIQSIRLDGPGKLESFQQELKRRKPRGRDVRFLYISDPTRAMDGRYLTTTLPPKPLVGSSPALQLGLANAQLHEMARHRAMTAVLDVQPSDSFHTFDTVIPSTVEVLTLCGHSSPIFKEPENLIFSRLKFLTTSGQLFYSLYS
jgi:hypothetical protein